MGLKWTFLNFRMVKLPLEMISFHHLFFHSSGEDTHGHRIKENKWYQPFVLRNPINIGGKFVQQL